jgi:Transposase DDE domain
MTGSSPTDRSKTGQAKRHILTDKKGIPLSTVITSANTHDIKAVTKMLSTIPFSFDLLNRLSQRKRQGGSIIIYALIESI